MQQKRPSKVYPSVQMKQLDFEDDEGSAEVAMGSSKFNDLSYALLHG